MHRVAAAALVAVVRARRHLQARARRGILTRIGILVALATAVGLGALAAARPAETVATRPIPIVAVPQGVLRTQLRTGEDPDATIEIAFSSAMDRESVRASLNVDPPGAVRLDWNAEGTVVTVAPLGRWAVATYYTITVEPGALAVTGVPLSTPVRAAFLTRRVTTAMIQPTARAGDLARLDTAFAVEFDRPIDAKTLPGAFLISPVVAGAWERDQDHAAGARYTFSPLARLAADTTYSVELSRSVRDADGGTIATVPREVRTVPAPAVLALRPTDGTSYVARNADVSVRFSERMDRESTADAFSASVGKRRLKGAINWSTNDTVLTFDPTEPLGYGQDVVLRVSTEALSNRGAPLAKPVTAGFTTVPRAAPGAIEIAGDGGGAATGSGAWTAIESWYLGLMNCTRTGGLVTSRGACSSPGGRSVAPLALDGGISTNVARPYARLLATRNACSHFVGGSPADRLRRAGYASSRWAENIGCRSGDPAAAVLGSHLFFQAERSYNGGHYRNLMNAAYSRVGIGVWVSGGRVRLVVDFYHPR